MTTPSIKLTRAPAAPALLELDATQAKAAAHRGSPLLIAGGPGTGKTSVLIESALSRITTGQDPDSILLITYGRERASELRDAIALRTTVTMHEPLARTFSRRVAPTYDSGACDRRCAAHRCLMVETPVCDEL